MDVLYETLVFSASCQIKLADVQEDRVRRGEGGGEGVLGPWETMPESPTRDVRVSLCYHFSPSAA